MSASAQLGWGQAGAAAVGDEGERRWKMRFEELVAFHQAHRHCIVPKAHGVLGRWVARQRELYRQGKLALVRVDALESLGFSWSSNDTAWMHKYAQLKTLAETSGSSVMRSTDGDLGSWVAKQRQLRRRGMLSESRRAMLDEIGFVWEFAEMEWDQKLAQLRAWVKQTGHTRVPFSQGELGRWVNTQRQMYRRGKLAHERYHILSEMGFDWNPKCFNSRQRLHGTSTTSSQTDSEIRDSLAASTAEAKKSFPSIEEAAETLCEFSDSLSKMDLTTRCSLVSHREYQS
uniref:Helicase-associated domain-containing protein n=1 Tax=Erythrolobus australicus TaxID=1077150 RepID=A0A7S1TJP9_9RHOD|mmetsp:Transcript_1513/g.4018  ORF Transcript_1513/g.4018 Transcript_1513/m.4018 type:complete len:287 (+) Transcript_1513:181-1041(+)